MLVIFDVLGASLTDSIHNIEGKLEVEQKFNLVLRAEKRSKIVLASGEHLSDIDVHLSLSTRWTKPTDLDLSSDDAGFLSFSEGGYEGPHIGGAIVWPIDNFPVALLSNGVNGFVSLSFSTVPTILDDDKPFIWNSGKLDALKIASASISTVSDSIGLDS